MAGYSIFVPARKDSGMPDITITVEASNWLVALKEGLRKVGEQGDNLSNILCETSDDGSMRVADPRTKRVFIIREGAAAAQVDEGLVREAEERARRSREEAERAEAARVEALKRLEETRRQEEAARAAAAAEAAAVTRQRQAAEDALAVARQEAEERARQAAEDATGTVGSIRVEEVKAATREAFLPKKKDERWEDLDDWYGSDGDGSALENTLDSVLSDVFMATENIYNLEPAEASGVVLDQAMKHVRAEAGSVFLVELNTALQDLVIAAARGPIARNLEGLKLPRGKGIVGFSALKGIKLTVSNVQRNPNFYGKLDQQFGFRTRSLLCIPIVFEERLFGVLEMVNRVDGEEWTSFDHNVVESLANLLGKVLNVRAGLIALNL